MDNAMGSTLVELLRLRGSETAGRHQGYTFLVDGEDEAVHLSYAGLDRRARAIGALLRQQAATGERALLLYPPGLDYVAAFFGCLYAGVVAVPCYPPRLNRNLDRVRAIAADARPRIALLPEAFLGRVEGWLEQAPELREVRWLTADGLEESLAESWRDPGVSPGSLAFLQYTSGSTGTPKGVMVSHGNLIHNSELIYRGFGLNPESRVCVWLPPFHDMGLIGGILQPLYAGVPVTLMSPVAFLQRPVRWLRAIARSGATVSGGPNFAYDLCVEKVTAEERRELDLHRWEVAFNGAEPVRAATLESFAATFAECGLRREVFSPCYGLAEATLLVSCSTPGAPPALQKPVASGRELPGQRIAVVDPETGTTVPEGRVGEIWIAGPSVAHGYWNRPEATRETFEARLANGDGPYLRTGDLGFRDGGDLFVTGRLKDLIVIRGRNHYPQDIEQTVEASHAALRRGCGAAFPVEAEGEERLVIVQEVERRARHAGAEEWTEVFRAIRDAVLEEHGVAAWAVVLAGPGAVPKTSSGKIQRRACRELFLGGLLEPLASSTLTAGEVRADPEPAPVLDLEPLLALPAELRRPALEERLRAEAARVLRQAPEGLDPGRPLSAYGLDSLTAMELKNVVESGLGLTLAPEDLLTGPSLAGLTALLLDRLAARSGFDRLPAIERRSSSEPIPLSFAQRRLWFLDQLAPGDPAYNIPGVVDLDGPLVPAALALALKEVVRRHEALRTRFPVVEGEPFQEVAPPFAPGLPCIDLGALPGEAARREGERVAREVARQPFDLGRGSLLRAVLLRGGESEHRLIAVLHHTVADGWSLGILVRELVDLYGAFAEGRLSPLPEPRLQYADFARWQHRWLGPVLEGERSWWKERLAGASFALELPRDLPRPERAGHRPGGRLPVRLSPQSAVALAGLCSRRGATPFMALLAAFAAMLHRWTGQENLCLGAPVAGRGRSETEGLIGCFVNTVVLRSDLSGDPAFDALLERARETTLGALGHQTLPFERLVEALGRQPLFEAMLALQTFPLAAGAAAGVRFAPRELDAGTAQHDLTLSLEPAEETWAGSLEHAIDAIEAVTAERLLACFETLLAGALAEPERRLSELPLLSAAERRQLLVEWQGARAGEAGEAPLVHELVAAQARLTPEAPAVVEEGESLTYRELTERAGRLACTLARLGAGPEVVIGLCLPRSTDLLAAMLATLQTGSAYLPLDPRHPGERLAWMIRDAGVPLVLTRGDTPLPETGAKVLDLAGLAEGEPPEVPLRGPLPGSPAYILYTSGSTGLPKGVVVPHRALALHAGAVVEELGLSPSDRVLQLASAAFDVAAEEIFSTWIAGGAVVLAPEAVAVSPVDLAGVIERQGLTVLNLPTPYWREWLALLGPDAGLPAPLRLVVVGSDTVPPETLAAWRRVAGGVEWRNGYGVTEATITSTFARLPGAGEDRGRVPIGRPLAHVEALVLDRRGAPVPAGAPGELHLGGGALARGYLGRPGLTAERFVPHPWRGPGARLYRTGDLARFRADGQLELLGRADHQVKVRGVRVELGEIEAALRAHPAVREAAVVAPEMAPGERRLVAWLEMASEEGSWDGLREHLRRSLPEAMVPQVFVAVESLPRLPGGKLDRRSLAARPLPAGASRPETTAPRTPVEEVLAALWAELLADSLGGRRVGIDESFFDLGGHSLLATRLVARARRALGVELGVRDLFEAPTVAALARRVEGALRAGAEAPLRPRSGPPVLSFAQERLWFLDQLEPGSARYNVPAAVRLAGRLRVPALERAFAQVVERHEALRTTFRREGGRPVPAIAPPTPPGLPVIDLSGLPGHARRAEAAVIARGEARRPFDLARGPLLRVHLLRLGEGEHELLLCLHHIVCDGWSLGVLLRELGALYAADIEGRPGDPLPGLPVQYADYAAWQRAQLQGEGLERRLAYWRERLAGAPPVLELPTDRPRPPVQSERGGLVPVALPAALTPRLEALARERGATLFMALLAGFQALLHRTSRQDDLCVGTPVANRGVAEVEGLIGFFANVLVLRVDLSGDPGFAGLVIRAREAALGAYAHPDLPFEQLVEDLRPRRDLAHAPIFQAMLALQNAPLPPLELPGLTLTPTGIDSGTSKYDLTLSLEEAPRGLEGTLEYSRDLFDRSTALRLMEHLARLLEAAVDSPDAPVSDLPLASEAERRQVLAEWNDTDVPAPQGSLAERFEAQVERSPGATALVWGTEELTYRELAARVDRLARHLAALGAGPEVLVGVRLERTSELIVALLAILKTGAAYVPLDPRYPEERQSWILDDARARLLVTRGPAPADLPAETRAVQLDRLEGEAPPGTVLPANLAGLDGLAYVIYTSGSTGRPKGVAIGHRAAAAFLDWAAGVFPPRDLAGMLAATSICFDLSVFEIFLPLTRGGTVLLAENALELPELPAAGRVTLVNTVPSVMAELADAGGIPSSARTINLAGEPLGRSLAQRVHRIPGVERLFNLYGPSEDTTYSTFARIEADETGAPSIGRPIAGTRVWLVDAALRPVPLGVAGELCLSGRGLARGYLGRPELTAERFVPDPFGGAGERMYRTGDLARYRAGGSLEYLGRIDHQVKVRGFRIEPGEIEALLAEHPAVRESAVVAQRSAAGDLRLAAFVVPPAGSQEPPSAAGLRAHLRSRLPEHMVPSAFVVLPELPRMPNGKVNRRGLADGTAVPGERLADADTSAVAPRTPLEEALAGLWREVLGAGPPGVHDDFFELGGHSLLAPRLATRIGEALGVELPVRALFEAPTIAGLAERIEEARRRGAPPVPPVRPRPAGAPVPLSFAQERFWFLDRLEPGSAHYNLPAGLRLTGPLDAERLGRALLEVARRHESLRTTFAGEEDGPVQVISPEPAVPLAVVDLSGLLESERIALELAKAEVRRPFDLSRGPLLRTLLIRLGAAEHVLVATLHHAVADGWSLGILVEELAAFYGALAGGRPSPLPPLPAQAADFALWQRERAAEGAFDGQLDYWRHRLEGLPPALDLPSDRPRLAVPGHGGGRVPVELEPALAAGLDALGRRRGATPFMTLLAAFGVVLSRRSRQLDLAAGSPVANRPRPEVEGVIGPLVNTLVLRLDLEGEPSFLELLDRVRETAFGAYAHQDLPFERLVQEVNPGRDLGRQPLFQVLFAWQSFRLEPASPVPRLDFVPFEVESGMAHFDLSLFLQPRGDGIVGSLEHSTDLFDAATVSRIAGQLRQVLAAAIEDPERPVSELVTLSPEERRQLLLHPAAPAAGERAAESSRRTLPRTLVEEMLAGVWAEVLGVREIGVHDSFFELGGHSLLAARVLSRLRRLLPVELPMRALFESPTVAALAGRVEEALRQPGAGAPAEPIPRAPRETPPPLSSAQRRLWFLDRLEPGSAAYNIPAALDLEGALDVSALRRALAGVVARHEALRTTFSELDGRPVQVIAAALLPEMPLVDLSGLSAAARHREADRLAEEEAGRPFDLTRGPLLRPFLIRLGGRTHRAVLNVHHAVSDGWSMGVLVRELGALYAGEELPAPPLQYADWAVWQNGWLQGEALEAQLAFWRSRLAGAPPALTLPLDRPRPAMQTSRGASLTAVLPAALTDRLRAASREAGTTLFMTLLAAFQSLLARHAAQEDVTVGTPVANRTRTEVEGVIGCFVNTLPLRLDLAGDPSLRELVAQARRAALDAYAHQNVPFELLVEELRPGRDLSHAPLFQVMLVFQNTPPAALALPGLTVTPREVESGTAKLDLTLTLVETAEGLAGSWEHNRDLFDRTTIARLAERWRLLLESFAAVPDLTLPEAPLLPEAERWQVLGEWNERGGEAFPPATLHGLFAAQAARSPEAVAVVHGAERWSYRRLDERAGRIAARLRHMGVGPETLVGVCLERSPDLIAALLGVMRAGGAYVPIDPAYPEDRRRFLLEDAGAPVVVTQSALLDRVDGCGARPLCVDLVSDEEGPGEDAGGPEAGERHLAYVIYTSGSTGRPKGVAIEHRSAAALVAWAIERFTPEGLRGVLACTSICFDLSVFEIFAPLACGGDVVLAADPLALPGLPAAGEVWLVNTVPSAVAELVRGGGLPAGVRTVNLAGEPLPRELVERIYALPGVEKVLNLYGPSEDTTYSTFAQIEPGTGAAPAIGRPLPGTNAYLLDRHLRPVPAGVPGELFLGGAGLARGYLGRPELTAERFIPDPFSGRPGERLYRTGDLARFRTGGELEFLGRIDHQVKLRGFRIELGEIEALLRRHPGVAEAVVLVREDRPGDRRLAAYVASGEGVAAPELRAFVKAHLPEFMVPSAFVVLPALPLTPNGKVDRRALPAPDAVSEGDDGASASPRGAVAEILAAIWCDVLGVERAGAADDFFVLGGHSLLATQLVSRVRQTFGVDLPLRRLFDDPSFAGALAAVEAARADGPVPEPIQALPRAGRPRLSHAQQRLWLMDRMQPGSAFYNLPMAVRARGRVHVPALERSLEEIARRHEVLRTTFAVERHEPWQVVQPPAPVTLPVVDLAGLPGLRRRQEARRLGDEEARRPFDLARGPLWRATLLRSGEQEHELLLTMHHIVFDDWSMGVFLREMAELYEGFATGRSAALPELSLQYADFARWQREWLEAGALAAQLDYWKRQLDGAEELRLPSDRPRTASTGNAGRHVAFTVPADLVRDLRALSRRQGVTLFMTLMSAFSTLLHRYSGQDDIALGSPIANRNRAEIEGLIGFFVNELVFRLDLAGNPTFRELLGRTREVSLGAYAHQDASFDEVVAAVRPGRRRGQTPLVQVQFDLHNAPCGALRLPDLVLEPLEVERGAVQFDLQMSLTEMEEDLKGMLGYNTDLFEEMKIMKLISHFEAILRQVASDPERRLLDIPLDGEVEVGAGVGPSPGDELESFNFGSGF